MTQNNYKYRTDPLFLRNSFYGTGKFEIPIIPKFKAESDDFENPRLISFDRTNKKDKKHSGRMVHFFLYDYKFEKVWLDPEAQISKLKNYRAILTSDFSMYTDMLPPCSFIMFSETAGAVRTLEVRHSGNTYRKLGI